MTICVLEGGVACAHLRNIGMAIVASLGWGTLHIAVRVTSCTDTSIPTGCNINRIYSRWAGVRKCCPECFLVPYDVFLEACA
jgi:hypothetical protein